MSVSLLDRLERLGYRFAVLQRARVLLSAAAVRSLVGQQQVDVLCVPNETDVRGVG